MIILTIFKIAYLNTAVAYLDGIMYLSVYVSYSLLHFPTYGRDL